ncbi:MAG TPA: NADH-quinone oxidoreductase subunit N [Thermoanaerobaculia bacterium]|nr:NADH-quinone oxidoreductase subunit N [Thermoanaerobaculia bacterium]
MPFDPQELLLLAPEILLSLAGLLMLLVGTVGRGFGHRESAFVAIASLLLTGGVLVRLQLQVPGPRLILAGMFVIDGYAFAWKVIVLLATAVTVLLSMRFLEEGRYRPAEYYSLLLLATAGMLFMASGATLLTIWIGLETMALASYVLAGYFKREVRSTEAALKYFILGAMSSGVLLYGISLLYGAAGTVHLGALARGLAAANEAGSLLVPLGWLLLAAGLFFKVAAVPFHIWTPDVYVGAPTPVTAWLAAASKGASFAILVRIFYQGLGTLRLEWQWIVALVAVASMVWGNLAALTQQNVKRMLAYSSIAHAGYVLIGVLAVSEIGLWSVVFYLLTYSFVTLGAFGTVILLERREYAGETLADYAGLARRAPFLAAMMLLFLVALTGIPPTGGFVGKVYLFAAAVQAGWAWVAVVGVVTSAISLYYYFGVVVSMYLKEPTDTAPAPLPARSIRFAVALCALVTLAMGVYPGPFIDFAKTALLPLP